MHKRESIEAAIYERHTSRTAELNVADLIVDPQIQRRQSTAWINQRVESFDVDLLGFITVNERRDGKLSVIDGGHRVGLMRAVGWGDQKIHAEVFKHLPLKDEALLFVARNDRRAVTAYDKFKANLVGGEATAVAVNKIVNDVGLAVSQQERPGTVSAIAKLVQLYDGAGIASRREGAFALQNALSVCVQAWGKTSNSVNGQVVFALGVMQLRYQHQIDQKELITKLAPIPGGPAGLLGRARSAREVSGRPLHHCIAQLAVDMYNKGKRVSKLESFDNFDAKSVSMQPGKGAGKKKEKGEADLRR